MVAMRSYDNYDSIQTHACQNFNMALAYRYECRLIKYICTSGRYIIKNDTKRDIFVIIMRIRQLMYKAAVVIIIMHYVLV